MKKDNEIDFEGVDLFEQYESLPENIQAILDKYSEGEFDYETVGKFQKELEAEGYTFDYYLDAEPYNLRKMKKGGGVGVTKQKCFAFWNNEIAKDKNAYWDNKSYELDTTLMSEDAQHHFGVATDMGQTDIEKDIEDWASEYLYDWEQKNKKYAKGGGIYSSDKMYHLEVVHMETGKTVDEKLFWAKNKKEAEEYAFDEYEESMKKRHGDPLNFIIKEAPNKMKKGGGVEQTILTLPKSEVAEIRKSIDMGYNIVEVGMISPKRKGIVLRNEDYEVRGTYPLEYKDWVQAIIDKKYADGGKIEDEFNNLGFTTKKEGKYYTAIYDKNGKRIGDVRNEELDSTKKYLVRKQHWKKRYNIKYADGGSVEDTGNETVLKYFSSLNMSALPDNAVEYIKTQILPDQNINILPTNDEDFVDVKNTIAELYPSAVGIEKQETSTETKTEGSDVTEWKEAIETLNMLIEDGGSKKDLDEWKEAVETLNMLIEG